MKKIISLALVLCFFSGCVKIYNSDPQTTGRLAISSSAELMVIPDEMSISLGVEKYDSKVKRAREMTKAVVDRLVKDLAALGVTEKNIEYGRINITPNYPENEYGSRIIGYTTSLSITVKLQNFDLISDIVDTAVAAGVNSVGDFNFYSTKMPEHKQKVRSLAIEASLAKAKQYEKEMGLKLGKLISVNENSGYHPDMVGNVVQRREMAAFPAEATMEELKPSPGEIPLRLYIDCEYEILK